MASGTATGPIGPGSRLPESSFLGEPVNRQQQIGTPMLTCGQALKAHVSGVIAFLGVLAADFLPDNTATVAGYLAAAVVGLTSWQATFWSKNKES